MDILFYLSEMSTYLFLLATKPHSYQSYIPIEAWQYRLYSLDVFLLFNIELVLSLTPAAPEKQKVSLISLEIPTCGPVEVSSLMAHLKWECCQN